MKKIFYNHLILLTLCLLASASFLTSCEKEDAGDQVVLEAFGPNPVLREGKIKIIGRNLDKVTAVLLPGCEDITGSDIERISKTEIRVVVPQSAMEGRIIIKFAGGEITSKASLSFTEPFFIESVAPTDATIREGDVVTITGDYLWNITSVVFSGNEALVDSADFVSQDRKTIVVKVHRGAVTGVLKVVDTYGNEYYSNPETGVLNIAQPVVTGITPLENVKGGTTEVTLTGENLDLVLSLTFGGNVVADTASFTSQTTDEIKLIVPFTAQNGTVLATAYSNETSETADALTMLVPDNLSLAAPDGYKAGKNIIISGNNLDLITEIAFNDNVKTDFTYADSKITVVIPTMAIDGAIKLKVASGATLETDVITLVKPNVTNLAPTSVNPGETVTITGTNLDLVTKITFAHNIEVPVTPSATQITVEVPENAISGAPVLHLANGTRLECSILTILKPTVCYIPDPPGPAADIQAGGVFTVEVENADKLTDVHINGEPVKFIYSAPKLYISVPNNADGNTQLKLVSSNGEAVYTIKVTGAGQKETVISNELVDLGSWTNTVRLYKEGFEGVPAGSILKFYLTTTAANAQIALQDANWAKLDVPNDPNFDSQYQTINIPEGSTTYEITLTQDILNTILSVEDGWSTTAIIVGGQNVIISKVSTIVKGGLKETVISNESVDLGSWTNSLRLYKESFDGVHAGAILKMYIITGENPQFALQDANWAKVAIPDDPNFDLEWGSVSVPADATTYEVVLTQAILDVILTVDDGWSTTAIILGGQNMTINKVSILQ
ncbi:MAG: IPT/TIG domain-containing protein [Candidatus Symbiothrix sp.]|jgi:hypothetical protein|nr:IPT/TIG domain-containing protein [Candidatus Symbiothrix sp.]